MYKIKYKSRLTGYEWYSGRSWADMEEAQRMIDVYSGRDKMQGVDAEIVFEDNQKKERER